MDAPADVPVREALRRFYQAHGFENDGGSTARWVPIKIGPLKVAFPNFEARRRALLPHDLHHIATGYGTTWTGEAEISAWEIAGGCRGYWAAWLLDGAGMLWGLFLCPRRTSARSCMGGV